MPKIARRPFALILALLTGLSARAASAAEIKVVCSGAMRAVLQQLAPAFEKSSGDKLVIEYATAGKVEQKVAADEAIDVAILTKPRADRLVRAAKLVGGTTTVLARVPIGLAVKSGAPHPDISSVEAVKRTLLDAKSIAYVDPASGGTSGIFLAQALEKRFASRRPKLAASWRGRPARRGRDRHTADQRADGGPWHRYCRSRNPCAPKFESLSPYLRVVGGCPCSIPFAL
jgi:Bacterial extracellular solute-binding protein